MAFIDKLGINYLPVLNYSSFCDGYS